MREIDVENGERALAGLAVSPRWITTGAALWGRSQQASGMYQPITTSSERTIARKKLRWFSMRCLEFPGDLVPFDPETYVEALFTDRW